MAKRLIRTEKWTKGKPEIPAYISAFLALNANSAYNLRMVKRHSNFFDTVITDLDRWHSYYSDFTLILQDFMESSQELFKLSDMPDNSDLAINTMQAIANPPEELTATFQDFNPDDIKNYIPMAASFIRQFFLDNFELKPDNSTLTLQL